MTLSTAALRGRLVVRPATMRVLGGRVFALLALGLLLWQSPLLFGSSTGQRGLLALSIFMTLLALLLQTPGLGVVMILTFLALVGGLRRWLIPAFGVAAMDPLLLVGPALLLLHFGGLVTSRRLPYDTRVSRLLLGLLALMALQIVNPLQGGLAVGIAGALFVIVPVLYYYLGRDVGTPLVLSAVLRGAVVIAILAAFYGISQTWIGFSEGEAAWVRMQGYRSLSVGDTTRPFSFLTSSAEYGHVLGIGLALLWAAWLRGNRMALFPVPLLLVAMVLQSSRGIFVTSLATCLMIWAIQGRSYESWAPRAALAVGVAVVGIAWSLTQVSQVQFDTRTHSLVNHQVQGLLNPLDAEHSTVDIHSRMVQHGLINGLCNPLGHGLGATTLASSRFGGGGGSAEMEPVNVLLSLGIPGVILYFLFVVACLSTLFRDWHDTRNPLTLGIVAVLFAVLNQWLNGGQYFASALVWFCIGALDRRQRTVRAAAARA